MILALDAGKKGALVLGAPVFCVEKIVHFQPKYFKKLEGGGAIFSEAFVEELRSLPTPEKIIIEKQVPLPNDTPRTAFSIALLYSSLIHCLQAAFPDTPFFTISPKVWQSQIMQENDALLPTTKETSIYFAQKFLKKEQLIPKSCRKPHDGIADAFCIFYISQKKPQCLKPLIS